MNREDGHNRSFVCVQLPEPLVSTEGTLRTIADISKERIRRVLARLRADASRLDAPARSAPEDLGFRVFKLAASNFRQWSGVGELTADAYAEQMALYRDPLVEGWTPESVIAEVALKEAGFGLNYRVAPAPEVPGQTVYRVWDPDTGAAFHICLDDSLTLDAVRALGLKRGDLFVCRSVALDDETAANLALECRLKTI